MEAFEFTRGPGKRDASHLRPRRTLPAKATFVAEVPLTTTDEAAMALHSVADARFLLKNTPNADCDVPETIATKQ
jgi:hypothetical protein